MLIRVTVVCIWVSLSELMDGECVEGISEELGYFRACSHFFVALHSGIPKTRVCSLYSVHSKSIDLAG